MEHRWGARRSVNRVVWTESSAGKRNCGRLCNVSVSGAYIEIAEAPAAGVRIRVRVARRDAPGRKSRPISAHVVRADSRGIGIEWHDFAPPVIRQMLDRKLGRAPSARVMVGMPPAATRERHSERLPSG